MHESVATESAADERALNNIAANENNANESAANENDANESAASESAANESAAINTVANEGVPDPCVEVGFSEFARLCRDFVSIFQISPESIGIPSISGAL